MPTAANGDNELIGRGKAYFNRKVNGLLTTHRFLGNMSKVELQAQSTVKQSYNMTRAAAPLLKQTTTQQQHSLTIDLSEFTKENVALAIFGTTAAVTQASATPTSETIFAGLAGTLAPDSVLRLAKRNVSAITLTATGSGSPTALVLGTDYEIEDATLGLVHILPGITTVAASAITLITASYTAGTATVNRVYGGTTPDIFGQLLFVGDPASGPILEVEVWNVQTKPGGAIALISDDFGSYSLDFQVLDDSLNHPTAPLYQVTYR